MATKQQIPVLAGTIVSNQEGFSALSSEDAQWAIENGQETVRLAAEAIRNRNNSVILPDSSSKYTIPFTLQAQLGLWEQIYHIYFGMKDDLPDVTLPKRAEGFDWLVVVRKGLMIEQVVSALERKMKVYRYISGHLDKAVSTNDRIADTDYAITVRDRIEADEELRNTSANQIKKKNIRTMTLLERLLLEFFVFHFMGEHLDVKCYTICAGSRGSGGRVPGVCWSPAAAS